jgi:hypothetical protein
MTALVYHRLLQRFPNLRIATIETGLGALTAVVTCGRAAYVWWSV